MLPELGKPSEVLSLLLQVVFEVGSTLSQKVGGTRKLLLLRVYCTGER
jgi:hypothetical protein